MTARNERLISTRGTRTQEAVAARVQRLCPGHGGKPCAFSRQQLGRLECGDRNRAGLQHTYLLCKLYGRSAAELGLMDEETVQTLAGSNTLGDDANALRDAEQKRVVETHRRTFLRSVGILPATAVFPDDVAETVELARQVQTDGLLDQVVEAYSLETRYVFDVLGSTPFQTLEPEVADLIRRIRDDALSRPVSVQHRMELYGDLARLYGLWSDMCIGLEQYTRTRLYAGTMRTLAREIGARDLETWSYIQLATADQFEGRYRNAVENAERAYELATSDAWRAKAASRAMARSYGGAQDERGLRRAVRLAQTADDRTPDEQAQGGMLSLDRADVPWYTGEASLSLGLGTGGKDAFRQAKATLQQGLDVLVERDEWPRCQAQIRLGIALTLAHLGQPEAACEHARISLSTPGVLPLADVRDRVDSLLSALPQTAATKPLRELTGAWKRGELTSA